MFKNQNCVANFSWINTGNWQSVLPNLYSSMNLYSNVKFKNWHNNGAYLLFDENNFKWLVSNYGTSNPGKLKNMLGILFVK